MRPLLLGILLALATCDGPPPAAPAPPAGAVEAAPWPSWRGPTGTGAAADDASPPLTWSPTENVRWSTAIPGQGHSSPIVWGDRVVVTTAIPYGEAVAPGAGERHGEHHNHGRVRRHRFAVVAVDRRTGRILWQTVVADALPHEGGHETGSYASASPVTDGRRVYASFGSRGVVALDGAGQIAWKTELGLMHTKHGHGEGSSPALVGDRLIVPWDHEGPSFVVGLDTATGAQVWRAERDEPSGWSTPLAVTVDGHPQVVISGARRIRAYDPATGALVWSCAGLSNNVVASPVAAAGILYAGSSYETRAMLAIRLAGARGEITGSDRVLWTTRRHTPYVPSPLLAGEHLYYLSHYQGRLSCIHGPTGRAAYEALRLPGIRNVYASPVAAAGRVYVTGTRGVTVVLRAGPEPELLATNRLGEPVRASLAIVGDAIYARGERTLFALGD